MWPQKILKNRPMILPCHNSDQMMALAECKNEHNQKRFLYVFLIPITKKMTLKMVKWRLH